MSAARFCGSCGAARTPGGAFCTGCGARFDGAPASGPGPAPSVTVGPDVAHRLASLVTDRSRAAVRKRLAEAASGIVADEAAAVREALRTPEAQAVAAHVREIDAAGGGVMSNAVGILADLLANRSTKS